jgi:large repetitive protein
VVVQAKVNEGTPATFQAVASDSGNLTYSWNFGDGSEPITGETVSHKFANNGEYTGILTVTDELGAATIQEFHVKVDNVAPIITSVLGFLSSTQPTNHDGNLQLQTGETATFQGKATDLGNDTLTYTWNFGDGSTPMIGESVNHLYANNGTYTATLTVTDGDGGVTTSPMTFTQLASYSLDWRSNFGRRR